MKRDNHDDELYWQALGLMFVECPAWRWAEGMLEAHAHKSIKGYLGFKRLEKRHAEAWNAPGGTDVTQDDPPSPAFIWGPHYEVWPDLRDDATFGCVFRLVQRAYGDHTMGFRMSQNPQPDMSGRPRPEHWVFRGRRGGGDSGSSDVEALLSALEKAPGRGE